MLLDHVRIGGLRVLHQRAAPVAIDVHRDKSPIIPRQTQLAHQPVGRLFPLIAGVIAGTVSRLVDFIERGGAEKFVVVRKDKFVMAKTADGRSKLLMVRTAGVTGHHVIDHPIPINEGAVKRFVAQVRQSFPPVDVGLRQPKMIRAEAGGGDGIPEHDGAFPRRCVVIEQSGKPAGC